MRDRRRARPAFERRRLPRPSPSSPLLLPSIPQTRKGIKADDTLTMKGASAIVPFGRTVLNITLARWENCTSGTLLMAADGC